MRPAPEQGDPREQPLQPHGCSIISARFRAWSSSGMSPSAKSSVRSQKRSAGVRPPLDDHPSDGESCHDQFPRHRAALE
jgi:hypothetical protein